MTEKEHVWKPLRNATGHAVDWMRLENLVGTGMPDVNGCLNGVDAWVENKVVEGNIIHFRPTQPAWIYRRIMHGGRVCVLARKEDSFLLYAGPGLLDLLRAVRPQGKTLAVDHRASAPALVLVKPFNWAALLNVIFGNNAARTFRPA